jgi:hypothetical protein
MVRLGRLELPRLTLLGAGHLHLALRRGHLSYRWRTGGAGRDRTGDLLNANQALSQLSYSPCIRDVIEADWTQPLMTSINGLKQIKLFKWRSGDGIDWKGCYLLDSVAPATVSLRKEVIQPQVLLRLPCYDFTPIMNHTLDRCPPCGLACRLLVQSTFVM